MQARPPEQQSWQKVISHQGATLGTGLGFGLGASAGLGLYFFNSILSGYGGGPDKPLKMFRYTAGFSLIGMALGYGGGRLFGMFADKITQQPAMPTATEVEKPNIAKKN